MIGAVSDFFGGVASKRLSNVAKPDLGLKRQCPNCGTKFFDLGKNPAVCPKCGTVIQGASVARAAARGAVVDDDEPEVEAGAELISLEDVEVAEEKAVVAADDEVEIEDEAADDTFLEEEEEDGSDDVSDLIDGDLEDDEER